MKTRGMSKVRESSSSLEPEGSSLSPRGAPEGRTVIVMAMEPRPRVPPDKPAAHGAMRTRSLRRDAAPQPIDRVAELPHRLLLRARRLFDLLRRVEQLLAAADLVALRGVQVVHH